MPRFCITLCIGITFRNDFVLRYADVHVLHFATFITVCVLTHVCNNCLCNNHGLCNINCLRNKKSTAYVITTACVIKNLTACVTQPLA